MEAVKQLPYDQLALGSLPAHSSAANDPNSRVSGDQFNVNASGAAKYEDLVYNGGTSPEAGGTVSGGTVDPGPTPFQSGDVKGNVYRYVTWEQDSACGNCGRPLVQARGRRGRPRPDGARRHPRLPGDPGQRLQPQRRPEQLSDRLERVHESRRHRRDPMDLLAHRHAVQLQQPPADRRRARRPTTRSGVCSRRAAHGLDGRRAGPDVHPGNAMRQQWLRPAADRCTTTPPTSSRPRTPARTPVSRRRSRRTSSTAVRVASPTSTVSPAC